MTWDQFMIFVILGATLWLFIRSRWRFDMVALLALFACVMTGLVPAEGAFAGFSHPAVITVIAVLVITRALINSGLIDLVASRLTQVADNRFTQLAALCGIAAVFSAFMNNVGALALLMPVAISSAKKFGYSPAQILMPISFASILGGLSTLIGTPPNIIIAHYRRQVGAEAFGMFDFTPVGLPLALAGVIFIVLIGRWLIPRHRQGRADRQEMFEIGDYVTEVRIPGSSEMVGKTIAEFEHLSEGQLAVIGLIRNQTRLIGRIRLERLQLDDILLVQGPSHVFKELIDKAHLELVADEELRGKLGQQDNTLIEAVVTPRTRIAGMTPAQWHLRSRYGVNLLAVSRQGQPIKQRLRDVRLQAGDVLLLQGEVDTLSETVTSFGCLPLASRELNFQPRRVLLPIGIFAVAIAVTVMGALPADYALKGAVVLMLLARLLSLDEAYDSIDWPVVVLLGAMIPVGGALETTGATELIGSAITWLAGGVSLFIILGLVIIITMSLSNIMNNAATSVVMAPIAFAIAQQLGINADPLLMAVAVGASCAFLTPIGHQNNTLVMGPGGYRFDDYWRLGLPLQILLVIIAVPLIPRVWPF